MRVHHKIETTVTVSDDQLRKLFKLHPKAFITEVTREKRTWPKEHYVIVVKAERHIHTRRAV